MGFNFFSVPPNMASLLLLSRAIKAFKPSLTKEVFSLTPVNFDALPINLSSIFNVVLIINSLKCVNICIIVCIIMYNKCIFVKGFFYFFEPDVLIDPLNLRRPHSLLIKLVNPSENVKIYPFLASKLALSLVP